MAWIEWLRLIFFDEPIHGKGVIAIALKEKIFETECIEIRMRLQENPNASIGDIQDRMYNQYLSMLKRDKENILRTWFIRLYNYDYEALQRDLCKCIMLNPDEEVSEKERLNLLKTLWQSCQHLFPKMDYSLLLDEIHRVIVTNRELEDWDEKPPFV